MKSICDSRRPRVVDFSLSLSPLTADDLSAVIKREMWNNARGETISADCYERSANASWIGPEQIPRLPSGRWQFVQENCPMTRSASHCTYTGKPDGGALAWIQLCWFFRGGNRGHCGVRVRDFRAFARWHSCSSRLRARVN